MTQINWKDFKFEDPGPVLVGGIGDGGPVDDFHRDWKMKKCLQTVWVIGRRDNSPGCFSVVRLGEGWDIAWYCEETPKDISTGLKGGTTYDAMYFTSNPIYKYLCLDLIEILKKEAVAV